MADFQFVNTEPSESKDTRSGFGQGLLEAGRANENVVGLCADLTGSLKMNAFQDAFPHRFSSRNRGSKHDGCRCRDDHWRKIPFTGTFANFSTGRVYDQIRQSIAYSDKNVKICASHAGLTLGEDGATHQILEDVGMMKMLPNMTVVVPCDYNQTRQATLAVASHHGPVYLRFGRPKVPVFIEGDAPFEIGKAQILKSGDHLSIMACGHLVWEAIQAALELEKDGIQAEVINIHTIKPLDVATIVASARRTGAVLVAEEHQLAGGLGESVAQTLAQHHPTTMAFVAVHDSFGESGTPAQLMEKYGLNARNIVMKSKELLGR